MKLYVLSLIILIGLLLISCDPPLYINYEIVNDTNIPITINYIGYSEDEDSNQTTILLPPKKSQIVHSNHKIGTPEMAKEIDSVGIYFIEILPDSVLKGKNIRDIKNWKYFEMTEYSVSFILTIN